MEEGLGRWVGEKDEGLGRWVGEKRAVAWVARECQERRPLRSGRFTARCALPIITWGNLGRLALRI